MANFVLVHGFWIGGWAWRDVARELRAAGHDVYPLTLTGLGERVHLASPEVDVETHISDIVNLIEFEDLHDVVLVAHSGGGVPVGAAVERVAGRIAKVVYLDSAPISDGTAQIDLNTPEDKQFILDQVASAGEGWRHPMPTWPELDRLGTSRDGLSPEQLDLIARHAVPQPAGTFTQPVKRTASPAADAIPKVLIACSIPLDLVREHPGFAELRGPDWTWFELPTGHYPMFSRPADTAALLTKIATG